MLNLFQHPATSCEAVKTWTLKQVQGDGRAGARAAPCRFPPFFAPGDNPLAGGGGAL